MLIKCSYDFKSLKVLVWAPFFVEKDSDSNYIETIT
jgi:hypothetical protein